MREERRRQSATVAGILIGIGMGEFMGGIVLHSIAQWQNLLSNLVPPHTMDHIIMKLENPETGRKDVMQYRDADRNQLANCMLLSREENGVGRKGDTLPEQWFAGRPDAYLEMPLIPKDPALWKLDRFEAFIAARKTLIRQKFAHWLVPSGSMGS